MTLQPFEQVIAEHGATILRVCRAIAGPDAAEDAWSETFLSALRAYPALKPGSNVQAWLVTTARRKAIDQVRAAAKRPAAIDAVAEPSSHDRDPTEWDDLWVALKALPTKQREAIACHHIAGMPYAEVARVLGNSEAAARRAAADGMKTLRKTYKGETP